MASPYYRPSWRIGFNLLWRAPITAWFAFLLAWVYASCGARDNLFVTLAAFAVFFIILLILINAMADEGRVRNPTVMTVVAVGVGLIAWYSNWVFWSAMVQNTTVEAIGWWPKAIHEGIHFPRPARDPVGHYLAMICEFIAFVIVPTMRARETAAAPFDEQCGAWLEKAELERRFDYIPAHDRPRFVAALEADPDNFISQLQDFPADPLKYTLLELHSLPTGSAGFVTVKAIDATVNDGKTKTSEAVILQYLRISSSVATMARTQFAHDVTTSLASAAPSVRPGDDDAPAPAAPTPEEVEPAVAAMQAGEFDEAIAIAAPFCDADDPQLRDDANRVCALSASRLGQWSQAADYWQALFANEKTAHNALQVSTSMVMAGYLSEGEEWFATTKKLNEKTADITPVLMHTNFITALKSSGYMRAAMPYLEWVKAMYETLHRTDPTFLTMQGAPFFESFIEQSAPVVDASMDKAQAHAWYASMLPHLDRAGQETLGSYLRDKRTI